MSQVAIKAQHEFRATVYSPSVERTRVWSQDACEASMGWDGWHHSSYSASCRHSGCHTTGTIGYRDWNSEIIKTMTRDLEFMWTEMCSSIEQRHDDMVCDALDVLDWVMDYIGKYIDILHLASDDLMGPESELINESETVDVLQQGLQHRKRLLERDIEEVMEHFAKDSE
jgi:hypothetical protein